MKVGGSEAIFCPVSRTWGDPRTGAQTDREMGTQTGLETGTHFGTGTDTAVVMCEIGYYWRWSYEDYIVKCHEIRYLDDAFHIVAWVGMAEVGVAYCTWLHPEHRSARDSYCCHGYDAP